MYRELVGTAKPHSDISVMGYLFDIKLESWSFGEMEERRNNNHILRTDTFIKAALYVLNIQLAYKLICHSSSAMNVIVAFQTHQ